MPKDKWIIKNETNRHLSVGDLQKLPSLWPGKVINVLNYYDQDAISNSFNLKFMINRGWVTLTKIKNGIYANYTSIDGQEAITTAENNEIIDLDIRVTSNNNEIGSAANQTSTVVTASSYTIDADNDRYLYVDASNNSVTINLPTASNAEGKGIFHIKKTDSSSNIITIDAYGLETIDGATTVVITIQNEAISISSNGTAWYII